MPFFPVRIREGKRISVKNILGMLTETIPGIPVIPVDYLRYPFKKGILYLKPLCILFRHSALPIHSRKLSILLKDSEGKA